MKRALKMTGLMAGLVLALSPAIAEAQTCGDLRSATSPQELLQAWNAEPCPTSEDYTARSYPDEAPGRDKSLKGVSVAVPEDVLQSDYDPDFFRKLQKVKVPGAPELDGFVYAGSTARCVEEVLVSFPPRNRELAALRTSQLATQGYVSYSDFGIKSVGCVEIAIEDFMPDWVKSRSKKGYPSSSSESGGEMPLVRTGGGYETKLLGCNVLSDDTTACARQSVFVYVRNANIEAACTGTIITDRHVLTAAHCVCENVGKDEKPTLGINTNDHFDNVGQVYAESVTFYYDSKVKNAKAMNTFPNGGINKRKDCSDYTDRGDLAIIDMGEKRITGTFEKAQILNDPSVIDAGSAAPVKPKYTVHGMGRFDFVYNNKKNKTPYLRTVANDLVLKGLHSKEGLPAILVGRPTVAVCSGDSGGGLFTPLSSSPEKGVAPLALIGVVSGKGTENACILNGKLNYESKPIVRLDTPKVIDWIKDVVGDNAMFTDKVVRPNTAVGLLNVTD